jgi:diguanylate cyclase (GGDEF)-like protein
MMTRNPDFLWKRYAVALILILSVLTVSHFIESYALKNAQKDAEVIALSAKQRMLSQQIVRFARNTVASGDRESADQLARTVHEFEGAHQKLMADAERETSLGRLYLARTPSTDEIVKDYITLARSVPRASYPQAVFDELEYKGTGLVLERLEEAVTTYDERARKQSNWVHALQRITLLVAGFIVLLEALLIFLPAHRSVRQKMTELRAMAETDPLTNLRNRTGFEHDMEASRFLANGDTRSVSLVLLDLDDFKGINDRYGHVVGDEVLRIVSERLTKLPNLISTARVGGDEFAILVDNTLWDSSDELEKIEFDMRECMDFVYRPIECNGRIIHVSGSVGLSRFPQDAESLDDLRRNASAALHEAKRSGRSSLSLYGEKIDKIARLRRTIQSSLLSGEFKKQVSISFQPVVDISCERIVSVEALARWFHPELGHLNPELFLSIARECGLGDEVDRFLRALALQQMSVPLDEGRVGSISLNISPVDLATRGFANSMLEQFSSLKVRPSQVWVEVTETERLTSRTTVRENLETLNRNGVRIALDDYGVGYSNVRRLAELPIQRIKVDKSIVANVKRDPKFAGVFRSSVQLATALGADIVAEGVETRGQLEEVRRRGCNLVQGFFFFKPMIASDCIKRLENACAAAA